MNPLLLMIAILKLDIERLVPPTAFDADDDVLVALLRGIKSRTGIKMD